MASNTAIITSLEFCKHISDLQHPEGKQRIHALLDLFSSDDFSNIPKLSPEEATWEQIEYAHDRQYIEDLLDRLEDVPDSGLVAIDADTMASGQTLYCARLAAGAACQAVDLAVEGTYDHIFCAIRPPGHHAEPNTAMGFCFFNNVAIGALHALEHHFLKKVAIIDFDVHHGNGTETIAKRNPSILYVSSHQYPLFPMTGRPDPAFPNILNIPLAEGTGSQEFRAIYQDKVFPAIADFRPELILISAGFDAHMDDPLAGLELDEEDYEWITDELCKLAATHCKNRVVSCLEGGYDLDVLQEATAAHLSSLAK